MKIEIIGLEMMIEDTTPFFDDSEQAASTSGGDIIPVSFHGDCFV